MEFEGDEPTVIIDHYIDKVTIYKNGIINLSCQDGEEIKLNISKLIEYGKIKITPTN